MNKRLATFFYYALLLAAVVLAVFLFIPKNYDLPSPQKAVHTQFWDLPTGSRIAYTRLPAMGVKKPYPIVFLQGGPGGFIAQRNITALAPLAELGYELYLYDPVGSGQSARLANIADYTPERQRADLHAIVEQIGAEKVILIGQSWGAVLASLYLAEHAGRVHKAVFTGPGPLPHLAPELRLLPALDSLKARQPTFTNQQANAQSQNLRSRLVSWLAVHFGIQLASNREMDAFQTQRNHWLNKATVCDAAFAPPAESGGGFYAQLMTLHHLQQMADPRPLLQGNQTPVLLLCGQCDNQPWGVVPDYLSLFTNASLEIVPGAGHVIATEKPEEFVRRVGVFLEEEGAVGRPRP